MAHNATNVRYGGQETGINQQIASTSSSRRRQAGWYKQYLDALQGLPGRHPEPGAADQRGGQGAGGQLPRRSIRATLTAQQGAMQADAANRGATVDPRLAQDASNASLVRQALQGGLGALIAQHGLSRATRHRTSPGRRSRPAASGPGAEPASDGRAAGAADQPQGPGGQLRPDVPRQPVARTRPRTSSPPRSPPGRT
jgi:hypothetical protein